MRTEITIPIEKPFNLQETIRSHGWIDLLPNYPADDYRAFQRVEQMPSGRTALLSVNGAGGEEKALSAIHVTVDHEGSLSGSDKDEIIGRSRYMLRLDEDMDGFYAHCRQIGGKWRNFSRGNGYLMRSPTVFEDLVKVICTTNIQWGGTKRMVQELVGAFGAPLSLDDQKKAFPAPERIAAVPIETFNEQVRLGYRTGYIYELAGQAARGEIILQDFNDPALSSEEIRKRLIAIKGVGSYAAASMMMLLGRYDFIPVDTVFRDFMKATNFKDREFSEAEGLQIYEPWGKWKYLAYWFEMLRYYRGEK